MSLMSSLRKVNFKEIPIPEVKTPRGESIEEEVDRLYLEKCQEVNQLTGKLRGMDKRAAFLEGKLAERSRELTDCKEELSKIKEAQDGDLISRAEAIKAVEAAHSRVLTFSDYVDIKTASEAVKQIEEVKTRALELISKIPAVAGRLAVEQLYEDMGKQWECFQKQWGVPETPEQRGTETLAELAAEPLKSFEGVLEQPVTAQEILCLSSALRNLYEIHKCDGWLLYNSLSKVLEKAVEEYSRELGGVE